MAKYHVVLLHEWGQTKTASSFATMNLWLQTNKNREEVIEVMKEIFPGYLVHCTVYDFEKNEFGEEIFAIPFFGDSYFIAYLKSDLCGARLYGKYLCRWAHIESIKIYGVTSEYEPWD